MEDFESPRAFIGASGIREIINFVESAADEISFAQPISNFSIVQERRHIIPSFDQMGEAPLAKHIPAWLPA